MIKGCLTSKDLLEKQTDEEISKMNPEVVLTLAGIKILKTKFKDNIKEWRFVVAKAIQQIKGHCGQEVSIDALCDKLCLDLVF